MACFLLPYDIHVIWGGGYSDTSWCFSSGDSIFYLWYKWISCGIGISCGFLLVWNFGCRRLFSDCTGTGITGGGSLYTALLPHAEGVLYGTELGSVTLKRVVLFCFSTKILNTHTPFRKVRVSRGRPTTTGPPRPHVVPSPNRYHQEKTADIFIPQGMKWEICKNWFFFIPKRNLQKLVFFYTQKVLFHTWNFLFSYL
jgi:hypothetical protein